MPDFNNPYGHLGKMHNDGVEYVTQRLGNKDLGIISKNDIFECTAEFMYKKYCCNENIENFSNIHVMVFHEFLFLLHEKIQSKSFIEWLKEANVSQEYISLLELVTFTSESEADVSQITSIESYPPYILMKSIEGKALQSSQNEKEKRVIGMIAAVGLSSMKYAIQISQDPVHEIENRLKSLSQKINYVDKTTDNSSENKKGFKWAWKNDMEGALGGFISSSVEGVPLDWVGATIGAALGALGGGISQSVVKSIPYFR